MIVNTDNFISSFYYSFSKCVNFNCAIAYLEPSPSVTKVLTCGLLKVGVGGGVAREEAVWLLRLSPHQFISLSRFCLEVTVIIRSVPLFTTSFIYCLFCMTCCDRSELGTDINPPGDWCFILFFLRYFHTFVIINCTPH